jgi:hypothetical protein
MLMCLNENATIFDQRCARTQALCYLLMTGPRQKGKAGFLNRIVPKNLLCSYFPDDIAGLYSIYLRLPLLLEFFVVRYEYATI